MVLLDVRDSFVSAGKRARDDNGVPIDPETWKIDWQQTGARRGRPRPLSRCGRGLLRCDPVPSFLASHPSTYACCAWAPCRDRPKAAVPRPSSCDQAGPCNRLPADISLCFPLDVALDHPINKRAETEGLQSAGRLGSLFLSMCGMPGRVLSKQVCNLLILLNRNAEPLLFTDAVWYGQSPSRSLDIPSRLAVLSPPAATLRSPLGRLGVAL